MGTCFVELKQSELEQIDGGVNWAQIGTVLVQAAVYGGVALGGVAVGVAVVAGTWYVLDRIYGN